MIDPQIMQDGFVGMLEQCVRSRPDLFTAHKTPSIEDVRECPAVVYNDRHAKYSALLLFNAVSSSRLVATVLRPLTPKLTKIISRSDIDLASVKAMISAWDEEFQHNVRRTVQEQLDLITIKGLMR